LKDLERAAKIDRTATDEKGSRVEITKVEIRPMRDEGNLKVFCSVVFDEVFIVRSVKIIEGKECLFVAMPSREVKNGEFRDTAHPIDNDFRLRMETAILAKYVEVVGQGVGVSGLPMEDVTF